MPRSVKLTKRQIAKKYGFQSGLEIAIANQIMDIEGHNGGYESVTYKFIQPAKNRRYTPDFHLRNGIIIESKGRFLLKDRQKHLWFREQHPEIDLRFVFTNSKAKISKKSKTTYAEWCTKNGFQYSDVSIPLEWFKEKKE